VAALAYELNQYCVARRSHGTRHISTGCVQQAKHRKLVVNPSAELGSAAKPALVLNGARGPRISCHKRTFSGRHDSTQSSNCRKLLDALGGEA
jgi:hypothetical protein